MGLGYTVPSLVNIAQCWPFVVTLLGKDYDATLLSIFSFGTDEEMSDERLVCRLGNISTLPVSVY